LTSNRVGTFDQAFKSRIQLALHYEDLTKPQRRKIWRNFFTRLKELKETNVDFDDLFDHIDNLAEEEMNGRQIRNSITIARQLAKYDDEEFGYEHLGRVIKVAAKFDGYLKGVYHGLSPEQLARDASLR
jgi:ATP-dependent Clp protease ATP-binding subunit ClpA